MARRNVRRLHALSRFPSRSRRAKSVAGTLMQILPGAAEQDFKAFGEGVSKVQAILGDHFAPAQGGGRFTSAAVGHAAERLEALGARGIGQSSWGPTGFAFATDPDQAEFFAQRARAECEVGRRDSESAEPSTAAPISAKKQDVHQIFD